MKLSDENVIKLCLDGDINAFSILVRKYQNAVYGVCYHITGNFEDAKDLTQESFFKAYLRLSQINDPSKFANWLYRIAVNTCKVWLRDQGRFDGMILEEIAHNGKIVDNTSSEENIEDDEIWISVKEAIDTLPENNRLVITLYYIDGLSYEEIGDFLSLPESTIKSRLHRARNQLRKELIPMMKDGFDKNKLSEDFPSRLIEDYIIPMSEYEIIAQYLSKKSEDTYLACESLRGKRGRIIEVLADRKDTPNAILVATKRNPQFVTGGWKLILPHRQIPMRKDFWNSLIKNQRCSSLRGRISAKLYQSGIT